MSGKDDQATPAPAERRPRLDSLGKVRRELAVIYFEGKHGKRDVLDASRLGNLLAVIARVLEGSELERRLEALERKVETSKGSKSR